MTLSRNDRLAAALLSGLLVLAGWQAALGPAQAAPVTARCMLAA